MIEDLKKSFNEIIYERTTSPFYGTLITSWLIWNWKILYLSFFISEDKLKKNKIDYILENYSQIDYIVIYPLISSFILITLVPFISNGAFWLSLKFNKWKIDQKNIVDKKQLLSLEQSIELIEEISKQEERFAKLVENKNLEIAQLQTLLEEFQRKDTVVTSGNQKQSSKSSEDTELSDFAERIKANESELQQYNLITDYIQKGWNLTNKNEITIKFLSLLESYNIIAPSGNGIYKTTETGKKFFRMVNR